jgi:adenine-specific DNA-methyltransferase
MNALPDSNRTSPTNGSARRAELFYLDKLPKEQVLAASPARLRKVKTYGAPRHDNRLIAGDNLRVLRALLDDPSVAADVRLVYIDPPFATGSAFGSTTVGHAYEDGERGAQYLESLRRRVILMRELLAPNGSIYVHLDSTMIFEVKLLMDEVFGPKSFRNLITRVKCNPKNQATRQYGDVCDYLLFYTKSQEFTWNPPIVPWEPGEGEKEYNCVEEETGRRFKKVPCHLPGVRNGPTGDLWRGVKPPPGKHWVHSPKKLDELDRLGRIYWSANGNPRRKLYLDETQGKSRHNLWTDLRDSQNQNARVTGYPTEKNIELLRLIVEASSSPEDLVLDAYCGSGTTLAAAGGLGRRWIGIDNSPTAIRTTLERLTLGTPLMGSHARRTYIIRNQGEELPDADTAFHFWADRDNAESLDL